MPGKTQNWDKVEQISNFRAFLVKNKTTTTTKTKNKTNKKKTEIPGNSQDN